MLRNDPDTQKHIQKMSPKRFYSPYQGNTPTQTFLGVRRAFLPIKGFFSLKSADARGAGTRDEPLRTSKWEATTKADKVKFRKVQDSFNDEPNDSVPTVPTIDSVHASTSSPSNVHKQ